MSDDLQHAGQFLEIIERLVAKMDAWGYSLALRFEAYDRSHGEARMVCGGRFSVSCGFRVARETARWLAFAIKFTPQSGQWQLTVEVEDEDEDGSRFRWESAAVGASSLDEVSAAIERAFEILDSCILLPEVASALDTFRAKKKG